MADRKYEKLKRKFEQAKRKLEDRALTIYGGTQDCPWCKQTAQTGDEWSFKVWDHDLDLDILTCGCCGGTSLWRFEMGAIYVGPLKPPMPTKLEGAVWSEKWRSYLWKPDAPTPNEKEEIDE